MAFQISFGQRNAFQILTSAVTSAAGKLRKRLKRNTQIKARADELAEKYQRLLDNQSQTTAPIIAVMEDIFKPHSRETTLEEAFALPQIEAIDFEALAKDTKARKEFLLAIKTLAEQQEEEMALILILAAL